MNYCTQQQLIDRFTEAELVQLTDAADVGVIDAAVVSKAIADASSLIDSYVRSRYPLPLLSVPGDLERIACDIARFYLFADSVPDAVKYRYEDAMKWLKQLAAGVLSLPADVVAIVDTGLTSVSVNSTTPVFSDDLLSKMA